jgi:hypothetical protein
MFLTVPLKDRLARSVPDSAAAAEAAAGQPAPRHNALMPRSPADDPPSMNQR